VCINEEVAAADAQSVRQHIPEYKLMRYSLLELLIAPLAALVACGTPVPTSGDVVADQFGQVTLRTDGVAYQASPAGGEGPYHRHSVTLVAQLSNEMPGPLYLQRCYPDTPYPVYGVLAAEEGRGAAYDPVWACVGHDTPIVVLAGQTRTDSLRILGPNAWDGRTNQPLGDLVGRFRLSYRVGTCRGIVGCELPGASVKSNDFEVRLGQ
jgi:hypothetical protein